MSETTIDDTTTRRTVMAAAVSVLGISALTGQASAQTGTVGTSSKPYSKAYLYALVFEGLSDDPTSPAEGQIWYRGDL